MNLTPSTPLTVYYCRVLYRKKKLDDEEEEPFLDPNVLFRNSSKALLQTAFSEDGRLVAFVVSEKGSDLSAIKVYDCAIFNDFYGSMCSFEGGI